MQAFAENILSPNEFSVAMAAAAAPKFRQHFILGSVKPRSSGRGYKRLGGPVTGESSVAQWLNVRFQDVDWGSTTRRSEIRWRPEDAFPVASD